MLVAVNMLHALRDEIRITQGCDRGAHCCCAVSLLATATLLLICDVVLWTNEWPKYVMASPSDPSAAYTRFWPLFLKMGWPTLWRTVTGLDSAVLIDTLLETQIGLSRSRVTRSAHSSWASTPFPRPR